MPDPIPPHESAVPFPGAAGEMAARVRATDWSRTPLGPIGEWPHSLRALVGVVLEHPMPSILLWGAELTQVYNDAYAVLAAAKHPAALGMSTRQCWPEVWHINRPIYEAVLSRGEAVLREDALYPLERHGAGRPEAAYLTISYSPARDDAGRIAGVFITISETTGKVRAEERLRQSEALLAEAQEVAHVGSWNWDLRTDAITWSAEHYRIVGLRPQEVPMTADRAWAYIHPDDRAAAREAVSRALAERGSYEWTFRLVREDGVVVVAQSRGRAVCDDRGEPVRMVGTIQDVTGRAAAEEAARLANERLDLAIRGSNLGVWDVGLAPDGDYRRQAVRFINVWEQLGYDPTEYPTDASASRALGHPDDLAVVDVAVAACLAGETKEIRVENRVRHKDGSYRWLLTLGEAVRDASGRPVRLIGTVLDITEGKRAEEAVRRSEQRLQLALDATKLGIWELNFGANRPVWSDAMFTITGLSREQIDEDVDVQRRLIHPMDAPVIEQVGAAAIRDRRPFEAEYRIVRPNGEVRWVANHGRTEYDESGKPVRMIGTLADVTERKRLEEDLRGAKEAAEAANRAKDDFLATVSHELRTPLAGILLWSQMLENRTLKPEDERQALRTIREGVKALQQLIEDLLDDSRMLAGEMRLHVRETELGPVVTAAINTVKPAADAKGVLIEEELDAGAGWARADATRLQQVVLNLLGNAVKFTPAGGKVSVRLRRAGPVFELRVADTGQGIGAEFLPHVFERFRQSDPSTTRQHGGLGLGLAIARELVILQGGTIRAESPGEGQGATFTVELPAADAGLDRSPPVRASGSAEAEWRFTPSPVLKGIRALVVEDDAMTREVIEYLLERCEADVTAFADASDALREFRANREGQGFDVVLSDLGLPEMSGHELMRQIRSLERESGRVPPTPAVALTAYARDEDRAAAIEAGFSAHLSKPVTAGGLIDTVARCVGRTGDPTGTGAS